MDGPLVDLEATEQGSRSAASSPSQDAEEPFGYHIPPFPLYALGKSNSADSCHEEFLFPLARDAIIPHQTYLGKVSMKVTDWTMLWTSWARFRPRWRIGLHDNLMSGTICCLAQRGFWVARPGQTSSRADAPCVRPQHRVTRPCESPGKGEARADRLADGGHERNLEPTQSYPRAETRRGMAQTTARGCPGRTAPLQSHPLPLAQHLTQHNSIGTRLTSWRETDIKLGASGSN